MNNIFDLNIINITFIKENYNYLLLSIIIFLLVTNFNIKIYIIISLTIVFIIYNYQHIERKPDKYNNDTEIKDILHSIKKYKKYNIVEYNRGKKKIITYFKCI